MSADEVLRRLLAETEAPLAEAELELHRLQGRIAELQSERYGLQLALARRQHPAEADGPRVAEMPPHEFPTDEFPTDELQSEVFWQMLSRAEAVERILERSDRPLTRQEVVAMLRAAGRPDDTADAVSAALAYLQRIDRAARAGRNQWVLVPLAAQS